MTVTPIGPMPMPPGADESAIQAYDYLGNPVCPGCHEGVIEQAARRNSALGKCGCPAPDRRLAATDTHAEAVLLMRDAVDVLDEALRSHHASCVCAGCRALHILTGGRL